MYAGDSATGISDGADIASYEHGQIIISSQDSYSVSESPKAEMESGSSEKWGAGFIEQLLILWARSMRTRRLDTFSIQKFVNLVGLGIIAGMCFQSYCYKIGLLGASLCPCTQ